MARNPKRSGNPATRASAGPTHVPGGTRAIDRFRDRSRSVLIAMSRLPPLTIPVVMLVLVLLGLYTVLWVAIPALLLAAGFIVWLAVLSWPILSPSGRLVRGLMVGLVVGAAVARITGNL